MKRSFLAVLCLAVLGLAAWWVAGRMQSDETRLLALVDECVEAARARSPKGILAHVDDAEYSDGLHEGKDVLRFTLMQLQLRIKVVEVDMLEGPKIEIDPDGVHARVILRADVRLGSEAGRPATDTMVSDARRTNAFRLHLRKKDGDWLIYKVDAPPGA